MLEFTQKELAELTGKGTRQIRGWEEDGIPVRTEGNRKLYLGRPALLHWRELEVAKALKKAEASESQKLRVRKLRAETEAKEYELGRLRGTLVPIAYMESEFAAACARMRSEIESMAPRYASDVRPEDPGAGELVLDKITEELLTSLGEAFADAGHEADGRAA